ncbi:MAG: Ldh family oxidoreductase [Bacteroidetes bacterium]|nr:Ldh family oxidoreductase [Bacteroidota bacterium]
METILRYKREDLIDFVVRYMSKIGVSPEDAAIVGDVLVSADMRGVESHGLIRLASYYGSRIQKGFIDPKTPWKVIHETPSTALIDGGNGCGQVVGKRAMEMCIAKAKTAGLAAVSVKHSNHYGIAGYYSMMALEHDMIGMSFTNSQPLVAPTYGKTAVLGTNPISLAAPTNKAHPYVLDMATSAVAYGKIQLHEKMKENIPIGWGVDEDGQPTTDPTKIKPGGHGALLPLGGMEVTAGYKGYGLAVLVEIFCSALSGGCFLSQVGSPAKPDPTCVSHFFMAINIESFRPIFDFRNQMDDMIALLKRSPLAVGRDEIMVAGEPEFEYAKFNLEHGVPLHKPIVDDLIADGEKIGVQFDLVPVTVNHWSLGIRHEAPGTRHEEF